MIDSGQKLATHLRYLDGVLQPGRISGEVAWQQQTYSIPTGTHTLLWRYSKDVADSAGPGPDCGDWAQAAKAQATANARCACQPPRRADWISGPISLCAIATIASDCWASVWLSVGRRRRWSIGGFDDVGGFDERPGATTLQRRRYTGGHGLGLHNSAVAAWGAYLMAFSFGCPSQRAHRGSSTGPVTRK